MGSGILRRKLSRRSVLELRDPLYAQQWHLARLALETVWRRNVTGAGVVIAIVDDGIEYTHPDLADAYVPALSYDYNFDDPDPFPSDSADDHGTSAAGVAAAHTNSACGVGSAFGAALAGVRLISRATTDLQEGRAIAHGYLDGVHIYSNSWGPNDDGRRLEGPGRLAAEAMLHAVERGRDGRGSVYVWAAGNGRRNRDNCNYDGWANSRLTITVAAVDYQGAQAWYSEDCSMLLVSAPSSGAGRGITTTDLRGTRGTSRTDCTSSFGGTSAAAPLVAGAVALLLQAAPALSWREVQAVLIRSARVLPGDDWQQNAANLSYSHHFGFGMLDVERALALAAEWRPLPPYEAVEMCADGSDTIESADTALVIEHVEVRVNITHPRRGQLAITLHHAGLRSRLAEMHDDAGADYRDWRFGTLLHHGERLRAGVWRLEVRDMVADAHTGTLDGWHLTVYGHRAG